MSHNASPRDKHAIQRVLLLLLLLLLLLANRLLKNVLITYANMHVVKWFA
jgi:hypothetical protein